MDQLYAETRALRLLGISALPGLGLRPVLVVHLRVSLHAQQRTGWPPPGISRLDLAFASLNSVVLFGSGATMHYALENWKHNNFGRYAFFMLTTIVLGIVFLCGQAYEYTNLIYKEHVTWAGSGIFGASFFTLTGMHGFHVSVGVLYLIILLLQSNQGLYEGQVLRPDRRHAVLALRRRHLGSALLDLLSNLGGMYFDQLFAASALACEARIGRRLLNLTKIRTSNRD